MKGYWEFEDRTRACMTQDHVEGLLDHELMSKGVLKPKPPEYLPEDKPGLSKGDYYRVTFAGARYYGEESLNVAFTNLEDAEAFINLMPMAICHDYTIDMATVQPARDMKIEPVSFVGSANAEEARAELEKVRANKEQNKKLKDEYDKAVNAARDAVKDVWDDWHEMRQREARFQRVLETFDEYRVMCEENTALALEFLAKAFSQETIDEAREWLAEEWPA